MKQPGKIYTYPIHPIFISIKFSISQNYLLIIFSALDAQSEHLVQEALERIMKGRTVLTIAHRLSTIQNADTIAVLKDGVIVEQGSYQELLNLENGVFKDLMKHQTFQVE